MPVWVWVVLAVLPVAVLAVLARRGVSPLGPLYAHELTRLARRGTHLRLRVGLAGLLLLGLLVTYLTAFPDADVGRLLFGGNETADRGRLQSFGETFLIAFLIVQQAAVLVLTPVYAGGAMTDEKENGRLDFLLTTQLSRWELVAGKLAARLTFVLAVVAGGLPVLMLTLLFGAIDPGRVLAGFVVSVVTAVAVGSFALMLSVYRPTLRDVLLWCYGTLVMLAALGLFCNCLPNGGAVSPITVMWVLVSHWSQAHPLDRTWEFVRTFALIYLPVTGCCLGFALAGIRARLRRQEHPPTPPTPPAPTPDTQSPSDDPAPIITPDPPLPDWYVLPERKVFDESEQPELVQGRAFAVRRMDDDEDPFHWKERHFTGRLPLKETQWWAMFVGCGTTAFLFVLGIGLFVGVVSALMQSLWPAASVNLVSRAFLIATVLAVPVVGVRAAVSVTEERAKQTLVSLLTLPVSRDTILRAKLWGAVSRSRWLFVGVAVALVLALVTGAIHPFAVAAVAAMLVGYTAFCATAGLWLSVRTAGSVRAVLYYLGLVFGTILLPIVAGKPGGATVGSGDRLVWVQMLSPPVGLYEATGVLIDGTVLGRVREGWLITARTSGVLAVVGVAYFAAAVLLLGLARRRFEREGLDG